MKCHFALIAQLCPTLIGYNLTKEHKGEIIDIIHEMFYGRPVVLALGDGYNDSIMLQKSDIGVEIVNGSKVLMNVGDILTDDLQVISELIFIESRSIFIKLQSSITYLFMMSLTIGMVIFYFNSQADFSGSSIQESLLLFLTNVILMSPSIIAIGLTDGSY